MKGSTSCRTCGLWFEGPWSVADAAGRVEIQRQMDAGQCDGCAAEPRRKLVDNGLNASHGETMRIQGALIGCTTCWRVVGFRCGEVTFAGVSECRPNLEITALAEHYWRRAREGGDSTPEVERLVAEFRAALRGQGREGGRHASGG